MLSPSDFIALFSAAGGSAYSASYKPKKLTDTFALRFTISLQASVVFLLAFAQTQYLALKMDEEGAVPGVGWTEGYLTTSMPVFIYLIVLAAFAILFFQAVFHMAEKFTWNFVGTYIFSIITVIFQGMITVHALTLEISPAMMDKF